MNPMLRQLVLILVATVAVAGCTTTTTGVVASTGADGR